MWNFMAKDRTYADLTLSNLKHAIFEYFSAYSWLKKVASVRNLQFRIFQ